MKIEYNELLVSTDAGMSCCWEIKQTRKKDAHLVIRSFFGLWLIYVVNPDVLDDFSIIRKWGRKSDHTYPHEVTRQFYSLLQDTWGVTREDLNKVVMTTRRKTNPKELCVVA